jgi:superfamily II DNA or RNA helicase
MQLRDYQIKAKIQVQQAFEEGKKAVILCLPTGGGKTVIFADMTRDYTRNGEPVLIICNRKELIQQAADKLKKRGLHPTLIIPGYRDKSANLYVASIDTLRNREIPKVKVAFIDECHIRAFDKIVLELLRRGIKVVGFTATPKRYGKASIEDNDEYTGELADMYEVIIEPTNITQLLGDGNLVPAISYGAPIDLEGIKKKGNDYDEKDLFERFNKPKLYSGVVDNYLKFSKGKKALLFAINVEHSIKTRDEFISRGIKAWHVDGTTPLGEREKIFKEFAVASEGVLCNCSVATTGYDEPTIECVIIFRATMSLPLFLQMCGRGGRPCLEIMKTHFTIIDQGSNIYKHGFWQQEREWSLYTQRGSTSGEQVAPVKECEACGALIAASASSCMYCQAESVPKEQKLGMAEFELLDNTIPKELRKPITQMTIYELEKYREMKDYKLPWLVRILLQRGETALKDYAQYRGFQSSWVNVQLGMAEKERIEVKTQVWNFIKANPHLDEISVRAESIKKLKSVYDPAQIEFLMPKILQARLDFKMGVITE